MRTETIHRGIQRAGLTTACSALLCAAAAAQGPTQTPAQTGAVAQTQTAAAQPVASGRRKATNAEPGSPEAKIFASYNAPIVAGDGMPTHAEESAGKSTDGSVKIHGHWVIEVKEKDGTVKERHEFENSYNKATMEYLLAGLIVPVDPTIFFYSASNGPGSMCNGLSNISGSTNNECAIFSSLTAAHGQVDTTLGYCATAGSCYSGLTTSLTSDGSGGYSGWVWSATITPVTSGTFDTVLTTLPSCYIAANANGDGIAGPSTISPSYCDNNLLAVAESPTEWYDDFTFTSTSLATVTVSPGEILVFTVTISFS